MASQDLITALRDVFRHKDFKSKLQKEAIECVCDGKRQPICCTQKLKLLVDDMKLRLKLFICSNYR